MRKILLACGIAAALLYIGMNLLIRYEGYSLIAQVPSELTAIGAPTRALWAWLGWGYVLLVLAFGWGVWSVSGTNRPLRVVGFLLLLSGLVGVLWTFAPMHQREVLAAGGGTFGDELHKMLGIGTVLLFVLTVGFGAAAFGRAFRVYSIVTMIGSFGFGMVTALQSPRVGANLPTPYIGLYERISIVMYMAWLIALAVTLLLAFARSPQATAWRRPVSAA